MRRKGRCITFSVLKFHAFNAWLTYTLIINNTILSSYLGNYVFNIIRTCHKQFYKIVKKVEIQIAKEGSKTIQEKIQVAQNVLKICEKNDGDKLSSSRILDKLMETLDRDDNFLTED